MLWAEYDGRLGIRGTDIQAVVGANETVVAKLPPVEPHAGEEGGVVTRLLKLYERDPKLVREKRKAATAAGSLTCEVCGFDFEKAYGELGAGYIEVYHTMAVCTLTPGTKTMLVDCTLLSPDYSNNQEN